MSLTSCARCDDYSRMQSLLYVFCSSTSQCVCRCNLLDVVVHNVGDALLTTAFMARYVCTARAGACVNAQVHHPHAHARAAVSRGQPRLGGAAVWGAESAGTTLRRWAMHGDTHSVTVARLRLCRLQISRVCLSVHCCSLLSGVFHNQTFGVPVLSMYVFTVTF